MEMGHDGSLRPSEVASPPEGLVHGGPLRPDLVERIPPADLNVLRFILSYLQRSPAAVPLYVVGGYVRDLLLGKVPDDLDLSFCLRDGPAELTMASLFGLGQPADGVPGGLAGHAEQCPEYGVASVEPVLMQSDESKNKMLDTAKVVLSLAGGKFEVDLMPTIGEETYDQANRVPVRNQRGTPRQDALRRDLTVGALMLEVSLLPDGQLQFTLLDFFGGLADLLPPPGKPGVLRSPFPPEREPGELLGEVLEGEAELGLARAVGLVGSCQAIWWVKVLRDDPLRAVRALRFEAKLEFELDQSFWQAVAFGLEPLKLKVAGSRKMQEMCKLVKLGRDKLKKFMLVAFDRRFVAGPDGQTACLAPGLFGGNTASGVAQFPADVTGFDRARFERSVLAVPSIAHSGDALFAEYLVAALLACSFEPAGSAGEQAGEPGPSVCPQWALVCNGIQASNPMRDTGSFLLETESQLRAAHAAPPMPHHLVMAEALRTAGHHEASPERVAGLVQVWSSLAWPTGNHRQVTLPKGWNSTGRPAEQSLEPAAVELVGCELELLRQRQQYVVALLHESSPATAEAASAALELLGEPLPLRLTGKCFGKGKGEGALGRVPMHMRSAFLAWMEVAYRLLDPEFSTGPVEQPEALARFGAEHGGLVEGLVEAMYAGPDTLRPEYQKPSPAGTKKKRAKKT